MAERLQHQAHIGNDQPYMPSRVILSSQVDDAWLNQFNISAQNPETLAYLQHLIDSSTDNMSGTTDDERLKAINSREQFCTFLGLDIAAIDMQDSGHPTIIPPATIVENFRVLSANQIDIPHIVDKNSDVIGLSACNTMLSTSLLADLGLDAAKVVNAMPSILSYNPESVRVKFYALMRTGLYAPALKLISKDDSNFIKSLFILPKEPLLIYLAKSNEAELASLKTAIHLLPGKASQYAKKTGLNNGPKRNEYYQDQEVWQNGAFSNIGYVAVMNLINLKMPKEEILNRLDDL